MTLNPVKFVNNVIDKYRKEAWDSFNGRYAKYGTWREVILETIFRPKFVVKGKDQMTHLHPDLHKLHIPGSMNLPDWRKYRVEDHPALINFQKRCHACGLHDPWLRNYAWNFYPGRARHRSKMALITEGCVFGFVVAGAIFTSVNVYQHYYPPVYEHTKEYTEKFGTKEVLH